MKINYQGKNVVIIGLGVTGLSCVNFFLIRNIIPKVMDTRLLPPGLKKLPKIVKCCLGVLNDLWILNADLLVISPGVTLNHPILIEAIKLGIEIVGDIELFVRESIVPIVAITGSNGKSTVVQLVSQMARCAGWSVGVAGNIGYPVLNLLNKSAGFFQLYILELSSFQLETTHNLRAEVATVLNISEDHMDRYPGGLEEYRQVKLKIYKNANICVINSLDSLAFSEFCYSTNRISFGLDEYSSDYYLKEYNRCLWIGAYGKLLLNISKSKIKNNCLNYYNMISALALSDAIKIPRIASLNALCQFSGLDHRFQLVFNNKNISWINDSKATNVGSTILALKNLKIFGDLHLLLGGCGKSADFSLLKFWIQQYKTSLYCFGKDRNILIRLSKNNVFLTETMAQAIFIIYRRVKRNDIVLLSPACSSLDQFKTYKVRGFVFTYFAKKFG